MVYLIGLFGGFVSGFFGAGGGLIMLPALTKLLKVDEYKARGTVLATVLVAVLISAIVYSKNDYIDLNISIKIALGGLIGGLIGAKIIQKIPEKILSLLFDFFIFIVSIKIIIEG